MDVAIPYNGSVKVRENKKIEKRQNKTHKVKELWSMLVYVFPVVIRAFRTTPKSLSCWCEKVRIATKISEIWKTHLTVCKKSLKSALGLRNLVESKPQGNTSDKRLVIVQHCNNKIMIMLIIITLVKIIMIMKLLKLLFLVIRHLSIVTKDGYITQKLLLTSC